MRFQVIAFINLLSIGFVVSVRSIVWSNLAHRDADPSSEASKVSIRAYSKPNNMLHTRDFDAREYAHGSRYDNLPRRNSDLKKLVRRVLTPNQVNDKMHRLDKEVDTWQKATIEIVDLPKLPEPYQELERKRTEKDYPEAKSLLSIIRSEKERYVKQAEALEARTGRSIEGARFRSKAEEWCRTYEQYLKAAEKIVEERKKSHATGTKAGASADGDRLRHFGHTKPSSYDHTHLGGGWRHVPKRKQ